jgi:hypothetical protein
MPATGCPGNLAPSAFSQDCVVGTQAAAEAICNADPNCAGYGTQPGGWIFSPNYLLFGTNQSPWVPVAAYTDLYVKQ